MSLPNASDVHVDRPLTNISLAYLQDDPAVAWQVFPMVQVNKQSDKYFKFDRNDFNRVEMEKRAAGAKPKRAGFRVSTDTYFCEGFALAHAIEDERRENEDDPLDADMDAMDFLMQQQKLKADTDFAADFFTTGVWTGGTGGTDVTVGTKWDATSSTPIADIRAQSRVMREKIGRKPNVLLLAAAVWDALQDNADFLDRIKYTETGIVTKALLAGILEVDRVIVAENFSSSSNEGDTTPTMANIFGSDGALLLYVTDRPSLKRPSAGYTMRWNGKRGMSMGQRIKRLRDDEADTDLIVLDAYWDMKLTDANAGVFFPDVLN